MSPDESAVFELLKGYALFSSSQRRIVRLMTLFTETQFGSIKKSKCNVDCLVGWLKGQTEQREKREGGREGGTYLGHKKNTTLEPCGRLGTEKRLAEGGGERRSWRSVVSAWKAHHMAPRWRFFL